MILKQIDDNNCFLENKDKLLFERKDRVDIDKDFYFALRPHSDFFNIVIPYDINIANFSLLNS